MKPTAYWIPYDSAGKLAIVARPRGHDWLGDEIEGFKQEGFDVLVSLLTVGETVELGLEREKELAHRQSLSLIEYPIADYDVPASSQDFAHLIEQLSEQLQRGKTVGVHCRQSIGRSSLLIACLLARSSDEVEECFKKIGLARGMFVPDTKEQKAWVQSFAREFASQTINR
jgi:protein-tyrosine phosphatase